SPEQAKGRPADKRSDIWAFGCVVYEMLTGKRAFDGEDATEVIAAVVRGEPDWTRLPADVPEPIRLLLRRCLEKDRGKRVADVSTARFLLMDRVSLLGPGAQPAPLRESAARVRWRRAALISMAVVALGIITTAALWRQNSAPEPPVARFSFTI